MSDFFQARINAAQQDHDWKYEADQLEVSRAEKWELLEAATFIPSIELHYLDYDRWIARIIESESADFSFQDILIEGAHKVVQLDSSTLFLRSSLSKEALKEAIEFSFLPF